MCASESAAELAWPDFQGQFCFSFFFGFSSQSFSVAL